MKACVNRPQHFATDFKKVIVLFICVFFFFWISSISLSHFSRRFGIHDFFLTRQQIIQYTRGSQWPQIISRSSYEFSSPTNLMVSVICNPDMNSQLIHEEKKKIKWNSYARFVSWKENFAFLLVCFLFFVFCFF